MYNTDLPKRADLPTTGKLLRSTALAALIAGGLLVTTVLPAEYGIDPTGIGRALGLTPMGEIKISLAAEARADERVATETAPAQPVAVAPAVRAEAAPVPAPAPAPAPVVALVTPAPAAADEPATLNLGTICERLGVTMTAAFVADTLCIKPARTAGAAKLYRQSDFERVCFALQRHIERVRLAQREGVAA